MMRQNWMWIGLTFVLALGCASSDPVPEAAGGAEASVMTPMPTRPPEVTGPRSPRIYGDTPLEEVLAAIGAEGGVDIDYHNPGENVRVTYAGDLDLSWEALLEGIVSTCWLRLEQKSARLYTVRPTPLVTVSFQDESIHDAIVLIASMSETSIVIGEGVEGNVSLNFKDVPAQEAIEAIASTGGYVVVRTDTGWAINAPR